MISPKTPTTASALRAEAAHLACLDTEAEPAEILFRGPER